MIDEIIGYWWLNQYPVPFPSSKAGEGADISNPNTVAREIPLLVS